MKAMIRMCGIALALLAPALAALGHVDGLPSVHDTVAGVKERLVKELSPDVLLTMEDDSLRAFLSDEEAEALGSGLIRFTLESPAEVLVMTDAKQEDAPYWLEERGFEKTGLQVGLEYGPFDVWAKTFEAGRIGLGVSSFRDRTAQYFVALRGADGGEAPEPKEMYPGQCRLGTLEKGAKPYADVSVTIESAPAEIAGAKMIRPLLAWRESAHLVDYFKTTRFPATETPDQIVLTWSEDPKTTQTVQWRTSTKIQNGMVAYMKKADYNRFNPSTPTYVQAETKRLETMDVANDPACHRHTAVLRDLEPDTEYVYSVGDGGAFGWSEMAEFTTAPEGEEPFSFIYMGDAQNGLDRWGSLLKNAFRERPDARFYVMAGDLVNRGNERWDWDDFFYNAEGVYDRRQLVPAIGNHEDQGERGPWLYLDIFTLPENGPETIPAERAYSFHYSNAFFVILDSNLPPEDQVEWLDGQLASTDAKWKFVVYHHPAYSSSPRRDNPGLRNAWTPVFDKHRVDMALQGHDHAYLRTYPMRDQKIVDSPAEGTIYVVSVSGVKMYDQGDMDYKAFGMTNTSTYQVLDIQVVGDRLLYRAYDIDGELVDEVEIVK